MVPDFRRDDVWTPAFAGVTLQETFYETINFPIKEIEGLGVRLEIWNFGHSKLFRISDFVLRNYLV
jgi:hypothetical protein